MAREDYTAMSDEELEKLKDRKMNSHDYLIDNAPMGDERIYFLGNEIDAISAEQKRRNEAS